MVYKMDVFSEKLNNLLVETFRDILKLEEKMLKSLGNMTLPISEIHVIEAVGKRNRTPRTISEIAEDLGVTLPFVTNSVKKLEASGYVQKIKSEQDGRSVLVSLTRLGEKVDNAHKYFHKKMILSLTDGLSDDEKISLMHGIEKLDKFFKGKLN